MQRHVVVVREGQKLKPCVTIVDAAHYEIIMPTEYNYYVRIIARDGKHLKLPLTRRRLVPSVFELYECMAPTYTGREFDLLTRRSNRMAGHQSEPENIQGS